MQVLGVSPDAVAANAAFARRYGFPFPLLSDVTRAICLAYATCPANQAEPVKRITYVIGPGGRIVHVIDKLNATEHPLAVLRHLYEARGENKRPATLVYALGTLGYDFGAAARHDLLAQAMAPANPYVQPYLLRYLNDYPQAAEQIIWTLNLDKTPLYALRPVGSFADDAYQEFWDFLNDQITEGVEHISVPGVMRGSAILTSGHVVPVIEPIVHGMYSWTTAALVAAVYGDDANPAVTVALGHFLDRVYAELPNRGQISQERALNYAVTNALQASQVFQRAAAEQLQLKSIEAEPSVICRPDADCWDVKLTFFEPGKRFRRAEKIYRYTIDVSDVIPVPVGETRSWHVYTPVIV